jgi:hypothetical protein
MLPFWSAEKTVNVPVIPTLPSLPTLKSSSTVGCLSKATEAAVLDPSTFIERNVSVAAPLGRWCTCLAAVAAPAGPAMSAAAMSAADAAPAHAATPVRGFIMSVSV